jgi:predicted small lipoprotein YifL
MRARRLSARLLLLMLFATVLAGCGKKSDPLPPPGVPNTYPRVYPDA